MRQDDLSDDPEDSEPPPEERARAGTRSTWVSVAVNVGLAATQVIVPYGRQRFETAASPALGDLLLVLRWRRASPPEAGHDIALRARRRVLGRRRVLNLMTPVDPWRPPTTLPVAVDGRSIAAGDR
jgi:hypothetical protein